MCPDPTTLSAWFDGETDASQTEEIRKHLDECPACRATVDVFSQRRQVLQAGGPADIGADRIEKFWTYVGQNRIHKVSAPRRVSVPVPLAAAAVLALALAVVMNFVNIGGKGPTEVYVVEKPTPVPTVVSLTISPGELDEFFALLEGENTVDDNGLVVLPSELPVSLFGEPQMVRPASLEGGN